MVTQQISAVASRQLDLSATTPTMSDSEIDADRETVELRDRTFQRYSIENRIYYIPVDEVSQLVNLHRRVVLSGSGRRNKT